MKIKIEGRFEVEIDEDKYLRNCTMFSILLDELFQKTSKLDVIPFSVELPEPMNLAAQDSPFRDASAGNLAQSTRPERLRTKRRPEPEEDDNDPIRSLRRVVTEEPPPRRRGRLIMRSEGSEVREVSKPRGAVKR